MRGPLVVLLLYLFGHVVVAPLVRPRTWPAWLTAHDEPLLWRASLLLIDLLPAALLAALLFAPRDRALRRLAALALVLAGLAPMLLWLLYEPDYHLGLVFDFPPPAGESITAGLFHLVLAALLLVLAPGKRKVAPS
jgi:hypothetical protein